MTQSEKRNNSRLVEGLYKEGVSTKNLAACIACHGPIGLEMKPEKFGHRVV